ncbi:MAG: hypothetical protein H6701_05650 [Myxococcales bacterium]|nr:hypothetical protein [Myxococcales bacterium]
MSDPTLTLTRARAALGRRPIGGPALAIVVSAAVLTAIAWGVAGWLGLPRHLGAYAGAALLVFALLEIRVQRARSRRLAAPRAVFDALLTAATGPRAGLLGGLPWVGGRLDGDTRWTAHLEWEGAERLRLALTVQSGCGVELWICATDLDAPPARFAQRLQDRHAHRELPGMPAGLLALAVDSAAAAERWAHDPGLRAEATALVRAAAPHAAALDLRPDAIAWDAPSEAAPAPAALLALADRLARLAAHTRAEPAEG